MGLLHIRARVKYNPTTANLKPVDTKLQELFSDMTGDLYTSGTQTIGNGSEEVIVVDADFTAQGWWFIINLDTTNDVWVGKVKVSVDGDGLNITIKKGEFALFRAKGAVYAKASAGSPIIQYWAWEL